LKTKPQIALLEQLFQKFQPMLVSFAYNYLKSGEDAKGIVQEVFISVWNNRENLRLDGNLKSYLFTATRNKCLNFLEKRRIKTVSLDAPRPGSEQSLENFFIANQTGAEEEMELAELKAVIFDEVRKLPVKCREIFILSRQEELSHKEIADKLQISTKTIENQIGIALKRIRKRLSNYEQQEQSGMLFLNLAILIAVAAGGIK
jgi:RNA polymerase sigma-19 factor, ECF subfamily